MDVRDEVVGLFDQVLSSRESHARHRLVEQLAERARTAEGRIGLLDEMLAIAADPTVPDVEVGQRLQGIGMGRPQAAALPRQVDAERDHA